MKWPKQILFLIWIVFVITELSMGQTYETFGLMLPYELQNPSAQRMGGASVALPDQVPHIVHNPANLFELKNITFFSSTRTITTRLSYHEIDRQYDKNYSRNDLEFPAYSSISLPFSLLKKRWVLAAAYNGIQHLEMEKSFLPDDQGSAGNENDRYSFSMGLAGQFLANIKFGLAWTKWYGKNDWQFNNTSNRFNFNGNGVQIGAQGQFKKLAVGVVVYAPHDLVESDIRRINVDSLYLEHKLKKVQRFNGAINFGVAFNLSPKWTFGTGYGYQKSYPVKYMENAWQFNERLSGASKFSVGIEYALSFSRTKLPIHFSYKLQQVPVSSGLPHLFDLVRFKSKNNLLQHEFLLGASLNFKNFGIFLDSKWSRSAFCLELPPPPYS